MIRDATHADAGRLLEMGWAFFVEAGMPERGVTFDPESFLLSCESLAAHHVLLVAEHEGRPFGMLGAGVVPAFWNAGVLLCQELFWYVEKEHRKGAGVALLQELETRATGRGAVLCAMVAEHGLRGDAVGRLYKAKGFSPAESTYWKRLAA